jgi:hypothetical protein
MLINNQEHTSTRTKRRRIELFNEVPRKNKATEWKMHLNQSGRVNSTIVSLPLELTPACARVLLLQELLIIPLEILNKVKSTGLNRKLSSWESLRLNLRQTLSLRQENWLKEKTPLLIKSLQNQSLELLEKLEIAELNKLLLIKNPSQIKELQSAIRSQLSSRVYISQKEAKNLIKELTVIAKKMQSQDINIRIKNQDILKTDDRSLKVGAIPANFILQNRKAIEFLVDNLGDATIAIALERGGAFQLDLIKGSRPALEIRKIPKLPESMLDEFELLDAIQELPGEAWKSKYNLLQKKLSEKKLTPSRELMKNEHLELLIKIVEEAIVNGHKTIALIETMISGDSVKHLIKTIQSLVPSCPGIKFNVLIQQDTLQLKNCYAHKNVYPLKYKGTSIPISPGRSINIKALDNIDNAPSEEYGLIAIANGNQKKDDKKLNYILAEDVDYQLKTKGSDAHRPVIVFDANTENAVWLQPSGGATARDIIQNLIFGHYDLVLKQNGIFLDESDNTLTSTKEMAFSSNSLKTIPYSFFTHQQKMLSNQQYESNDTRVIPSQSCQSFKSLFFSEKQKEEIWKPTIQPGQELLRIQKILRKNKLEPEKNNLEPEIEPENNNVELDVVNLSQLIQHGFLSSSSKDGQDVQASSSLRPT